MYKSQKQDWDDGRLEYEGEFWVGSTEYDYTIDAVDGSVVAYDTEKHASASSTDIGAEAAESAALGHAGLSESQGAGLRSERDYDDGRPVYEGEIFYNSMEYEFEIDGYTGTVLELSLIHILKKWKQAMGVALAVCVMAGAANAARAEKSTVTASLYPDCHIVIDGVDRTFYNVSGEERCV